MHRIPRAYVSVSHKARYAEKSYADLAVKVRLAIDWNPA
jgi:hypothetical protein